ncbi:MAG: hypothetical protein K6C34_03820 [Alphaproteobacteria bacterium]|nr:hypothetical protein [Alphaproteobacteria bacterium]
MPLDYRESPIPMVTAAVAAEGSSAIALNPSITSRVVLATDDGYAIPTAITILSCLATTPELKEIIVLYPHDGLSDNNIAALKKLDKVISLEIPSKYMKAAISRDTKWNPLVQLRISYPELFQELRPELTGFIHMDSDTIAVRNVGNMLQDTMNHLELNERTLKYLGDIPMIPFFLATNLDKVWNGMYSDEKTISGGVVGWNLDAINKMSVSMSVLYELTNNKIPDFYKAEECYRLWEVLRNSDERDNIIKTLSELAELTTESELETYRQKLSSHSEDLQASAQIFVQFIKSIITFSEGYKKNDDFNRQVITLASSFVLDILINDSAPGNEQPQVPEYRTRIWEHNREEQIMSGFPWLELLQKWNFIMCYIFPQISDAKCPLQYIESVKCLYACHPELRDEILDEFKKICVMHFDDCIKPWNKKFSELAKEYPELYKIMAIYGYYCSQLSEFDSLDEWKMFFASAWVECISDGHSDCWPAIKNADDVREVLKTCKPSI